MLSPEDQQVQICLLKSNLEEIENSLIVQRSALPELDAENEEQYRETMTALKVSRAQNEQIERLKQENVTRPQGHFYKSDCESTGVSQEETAVEKKAERTQLNIRLTASRTQLKRQCSALESALEAARENRSRLADLIRDEERTIEQNIRTYEDSLRGKAERFRLTRSFYDEEHMTRELEKINIDNSELESEVSQRRNVVSDLKIKLGALKPDVPEDLPAIVGKIELHEKLKLLTNNCEELRQRLNENKK